MGVADRLQWYLVATITAYCTHDTGAVDYCFSDMFTASCNGSNQVVMMTTASYGRMQSGQCISAIYGNLGCSTNVLSFLDLLCSGQRSCETSVAGLDRLAFACSADFKSYLDADYNCVEVHEFCQNSSAATKSLTADHGYISLVSSAMDVFVSHRNCTLSVETAIGQRLKLKIYDFTRSGVIGNGLMVKDDACPVAMALKENGEDELKAVMLCSVNESRERIVATSTSNVVSLYATFNDTALSVLPHFLLYYEVIGCADLTVSPLTTQVRTDDMLTVVCNITGDRWHLICLGTVWLGQVGNCTDAPVISDLTTDTTAWAFPNGIATVISIGVSIGIILGVCLLAVLYSCRVRCLKEVHESHTFASNKLSEIQIPYTTESDRRNLSQPTISPSPGPSGVQRVHVPLPPAPNRGTTTAVVHTPRTDPRENAPERRVATIMRVHLKDHVYDTVRLEQ